MADEDLKKLLGVDTDAPAPAEDKAKVEPPQEDPELKAKLEQKANLDKAILEAQDLLRKTRKAAKEAKTSVEEDEELPKINLEDPSAKAWDKHIREKVNPMQAEIEQAKDEIRTFALREFLRDKPALSKSPEKLKAVMATYDRIKTSSERTREGVLLDLDRAYAAENHESLLSIAKGQRADQAEADTVFSDIAISRGATTYQTTKTETPTLSEDDKEVIAKMGMTVKEWLEAKQKFG